MASPRPTPAIYAADRPISPRARRLRWAETRQGRPRHRRRCTGHEPGFSAMSARAWPTPLRRQYLFVTAARPDPSVARKLHPAEKACCFVYGNYAGDVMNFEMAAEMAEAERNSGPNRADDGRHRLVAAGRPRRPTRRCRQFLHLQDRRGSLRSWLSLARLRGDHPQGKRRTYTIGVALEACSMPQTRRYNFDIGPDDIEIRHGHTRRARRHSRRR
jgi:dihydroxyacetone kinase-like protein